MLGYCQHERPSEKPRTWKSVLFLRKGGKHKPPEIRQLTGIPEKTQRNWVSAAKASGDWTGFLSSLPPGRKDLMLVLGGSWREGGSPGWSKWRVATPSTDQIQIRSKQSFTRPPNKSFRDKSFLNINFSSELFSSTSSELGWVNCSFQFVDFVNFIGNFQSVITQPNLAQFSKSRVVLNFSLPVLQDSRIGS